MHCQRSSQNQNVSIADLMDHHFALVTRNGNLIANEVAVENDERNNQFGNPADFYSGRHASEIPEA
jgi:hypothetical protein